MKRWILFLSVGLMAHCSDAKAHGGGLDHLGCHNERKMGKYHCHRGPLAGMEFDSKEEAGQALEDLQEKSKPDPSSGNGWRGVPIADEYRCSDYSSRNYSYSQSVEDRIIAELGGIWSPYTGECFNGKSETDIEHIVSRSEAHNSGLCKADVATRKRFASDLLNLTLASPQVNRHQKRSKDAAEWMPDQNRCWFANRILEVRLKYNLTIDQSEADALEQVLSRCSSTEMIKAPCLYDEPPPSKSDESKSDSEPNPGL